MRDIKTCPSKSKIQQAHIDLRSLYLPTDFIKTYGLIYKEQYSILIEGSPPSQTEGTLQVTNLIGGLAKMYRAYDLQIEDEVGLDIHNDTVIVVPPPNRLKGSLAAPVAALGASSSISQPPVPPASTTVFGRQKLRHVHIPEFEPANLTGWNPETEADVFLVFGMLSEYTDFRYCCGISQDLIDKLGYRSTTKPDAILVDRATDEYLMAEFKVYSSDFASNHNRDDVDVLVCWIDDSEEKAKLPPRVVSLKELREKAVKEGDIPLDEIS
jgi:hypothetical protein